MKKIVFLLTLLSTELATCQTYQLLPDSCTFCGFLSQFNTSYIENNYQFIPGDDTLVFGNTYKKITHSNTSSYQSHIQPFAFRQEANKLFGIVHDSINEFLIMDFDAQINDTIYNLYSEGIRYNAKVIVKDSVLVNNNIYHHFMQLYVFEYYQYGFWNNNSYWELTWNERGLCRMNNDSGSEILGGVIFNVPFDLISIHAPYYAPEDCTTDPLYFSMNGSSCQNCIFQPSSIDELKNSKVSLSPNPTNEKLEIQILNNQPYRIEIVDLNGQKKIEGQTYSDFHLLNVSEFKSGMYFIFLYSDQSLIIEKFIKL